MTVEFAVAIADSFPTQFRFTFPTLAEAARAAVLGDYVVVVEGGAMRGLNVEEQAEVERLRKESA